MVVAVEVSAQPRRAPVDGFWRWAILWVGRRALHSGRTFDHETAADRALVEEACSEVRAVYDDIKHTRGVPYVNNFWKTLAADPPTLKRTWAGMKEVIGAGILDPVMKAMLYLAVSVTKGCAYRVASHSAAARKAGMTGEMWGDYRYGKRSK